LHTKALILSGLFSAMVALMAQISIPIPFSPVPITGQAFGVFLAGSLLGGHWGAISLLIYVLLGAIGLPVFANAQGGLHVILGPSGGFLWGFVLGGYLLGKTVEKKTSYFYTILGMVFCAGSYFSLGTLQLALVAGLDLKQSLAIGVLPFLPLDALKIIVAAGLSHAVRRQLIKTGLLSTP
jgi:biotin transport system substrate-specific component